VENPPVLNSSGGSSADVPPPLFIQKVSAFLSALLFRSFVVSGRRSQIHYYGRGFSFSLAVFSPQGSDSPNPIRSPRSPSLLTGECASRLVCFPVRDGVGGFSRTLV